MIFFNTPNFLFFCVVENKLKIKKINYYCSLSFHNTYHHSFLPPLSHFLFKPPPPTFIPLPLFKKNNKKNNLRSTFGEGKKIC